MTRRYALALGLLLAACAPTSTSTDTAADAEGIRHVLEGWNQALTAGNDSLLAGYYTEDAAMMPPGMPAVTGRANIRAFWASIWPMKATLTMTATRFEIGGDVAVETGTWTWAMPVEGGEQRDHGKYVHTWRRVEGNWLIATNIWNSDQTPAEAAVAVKP